MPKGKPTDREPLERINWYIPDVIHDKFSQLAESGQSINEFIRKALDAAILHQMKYVASSDNKEVMQKRNYMITRRQKLWIIEIAKKQNSKKSHVFRDILLQYIGGTEHDKIYEQD